MFRRSEEKDHFLSGIWGAGSFIFRSWQKNILSFREQGSEVKQLESWGRKSIFFCQGANRVLANYNIGV